MPAGRIVAIFSLGGRELNLRLRGGSVRCRTASVALGGPPSVALDPFPGRGGKGVVEGGWARLVGPDGAEQARRLGAASARALRWDDLDLLEYAGTAVWTWLGLPLALGDRALQVRDIGSAGGLRRVEVGVPETWPGGGRRHVLGLDSAGRAVEHDDGLHVHELDGHCDFGGAELATRRRSRAPGHRSVVAWADLVAAHVVPAG